MAGLGFRYHSLRGGGMDGGQIWNPASELPLPGVAGKGQTFTFFADQIQYLNPLELIYPGGKHGQVNSQGGTLLYDYSLLSPATVEDEYGASVQIYAPNTKNSTRVEHTTKFGELPPDVTYPLRARWTALLYLPSFEPISLKIDGADASMLLDGQTIPASQSRPEQQGWHQVSAQPTLRARHK